MLCDDCKKREAVYHSVRKINGAEYERHLCAECQSKSSSQMLSMLDGFGLSELSGLFANFPSMFSQPQPKRAQEHSCPDCGFQFSEFIKSGFLGCPRCYSAFSDNLTSVVQKLQDAGFHKGKSPKSETLRPENSVEEEYNRLSFELARAIESENYEEAAVIRDRMRTIRESQL